MDPSQQSSSSSISIASIAYLSPPSHQPLHIASFPRSSSSLSDLTHTHVAFAALDQVDDALAEGRGRAPGKEGYLGLLVVLEDLAV